MGKSDNNTIDLSDDYDTVKKKILRGVTDPARMRRADSGDPHNCRIYDLHNLMSSNEELSYVYAGCKSAEIGCVDCKNILIDNVMIIFGPIQTKRAEIIGEKKNSIKDILHEGGKTGATGVKSLIIRFFMI